jgi:hypothetical protein
VSPCKIFKRGDSSWVVSFKAGHSQFISPNNFENHLKFLNYLWISILGGQIVRPSISWPKYEKGDYFCTFSGATIRPIWPNYMSNKRSLEEVVLPGIHF